MTEEEIASLVLAMTMDDVLAMTERDIGSRTLFGKRCHFIINQGRNV